MARTLHSLPYSYLRSILCQSNVTRCSINAIQTYTHAVNNTSLRHIHYTHRTNQSETSKATTYRPPHHNRKSSSHKIFQDRVRLSLTAGNGGSGCSSVLKTRDGKSTPNGGNGGAGGNIYIQSIDTIQTYEFSSFHVRANNGVAGQAHDCTGKNGSDVVINVPCGTVVHTINEGRDIVTGKLDTTELIDLNKHRMKILVCKGGEGGLGNKSFKRSYRRDSSYSSVGQPGEQVDVLLELKTLADVGLVGYPNAGKSSLLGAISAAKPTVASYPFTTMQPYVGIVNVNDIEMNVFTVADIPGLIDGAHLNRGLGHEFLRHIERTKILLYVIDISGSDERDPIESYQALQNELRLYQNSLIDRPSIIYCNKTDLKPKQSQHNLERLQEYTNMSVPIVTGSALKGTNMNELINTVYSSLQSAERQQVKRELERSKREAEERERVQQYKQRQQQHKRRRYVSDEQ